jgi:hypothetical protein
MIKTHEFNSNWWGEQVGIVTEAGFFDLSPEQRASLLEPYAWAEFRMPLEHAPLEPQVLQRAGFFQVDTQVNYRLRLTDLQEPESLAGLEVEYADEMPFEVHTSDMRSFEHERFLRLPGATTERVDRRYAQWSRNHIQAHPATCLRILHEGQVQGWYLGDDGSGVGLNLTLAMLSRNAHISGLLLFLRAYQAFAARGHRLGWASFSVQNSPVHNIYAAIGARFLNPTGHWFWVR